MTAIGSPPVDYWDMYFILKLLPNEGESVDVDAYKGTREYHVLKTMHEWKHLFISEDQGIIDRIAATKQGVNFYNYLVRIGFGSFISEDDGREEIERRVAQFHL